VLSFQSSWYGTYPWLHHEPDIEGVLCFYCASSGMQEIAKRMEKTFVVTGFHNWKHAIEAFQKHENSQAHKAAVMRYLHEKNSVIAQVSSQVKQEQATARQCLATIVRCVQYLGRQGLALRGHDSYEGNLKHLVWFACRPSLTNH
jgi:hypothetical protein